MHAEEPQRKRNPDGQSADGSQRKRKPERRKPEQESAAKGKSRIRQIPRTAREAALQVLTACRREGAWADAALRSRLDRGQFSPEDAALCSRIVYGVLQNRALLDFYLGRFCTQRIEHLQEPLPDILRMGAFQILFLDRVPDHAAVHEAVELARQSGRERAAGLVNAVLRKLAASKTSLPELPEKDPVRRLALRYSHPVWLAERIIGLLGAAEAERFLRENNRIPPVAVRVNPRRMGGKQAFSAELSERGITAHPHPWVPGCLELTGGGDMTALPMFREGRIYVQDPAAQLVTLLAGLQPGQAVLDLCAAPGGKTFGTAMAVGERGSVLACDVHGGKLRHIMEGARRLGLNGIIRTKEADGTVFHPEWAERFDAVLVDVPCSGLGIIRKKPEIRYKAAETLTGLPSLQRSLLDNAARYVRKGGFLVYSTCTILPEENEGVTEPFLASHPAFSPRPCAKGAIGTEAAVSQPWFTGDGAGDFAWSGEEETFTGSAPPDPAALAEGRITLWPQRNGTDGFYIRLMERREL